MTIEDTGDLLEVPPDQRHDVDDGDYADYAGDEVDLSEIYADPGEVVDEDLA